MSTFKKQNSVSTSPEKLFGNRFVGLTPPNFKFAGNYVYLFFMNDDDFIKFEENVKKVHNDIYKGLTRKGFGDDVITFYWPKKTKNGNMMVSTYRGLAKRLLRLADHALGIYVDQLKYVELSDVIKKVEKLGQPKLRDYQKEAVLAALKQMQEIGAATIQAPTGSGKTEMAVAIAKLLLDAGVVKKVFFLAHTKDLIRQAKARFEKYGIKAGLVDGENFEINAPVVAITVQTLYNALASMYPQYIKPNKIKDAYELPSPKAVKLVMAYLEAGLVIVDECHHVPATTVRTVATFNEWSLRLGLSATPYRNDLKEFLIYGIVGDIAYKITPEILIERGYIVKPKVIQLEREIVYDPNLDAEISAIVEKAKEALSLDEQNKARAQFLKAWNRIEKAIYSDPSRIHDIAEVAIKLPKPVLIVIGRKKVANDLAELLRNKGLKAKAITGDLSGKVREEILNAMRNGEVDVLIGTQLADEGLDLPNIMSMIIAIPGKSITKFPQRLGRAVRRFANKKNAIIVDIADVAEGWNRFMRKKLKEHAEKRRKIYKELGGAEVYEADLETFEEVLEKALNG